MLRFSVLLMIFQLMVFPVHAKNHAIGLNVSSPKYYNSIDLMAHLKEGLKNKKEVKKSLKILFKGLGINPVNLNKLIDEAYKTDNFLQLSFDKDHLLIGQINFKETSLEFKVKRDKDHTVFVNGKKIMNFENKISLTDFYNKVTKQNKTTSYNFNPFIQSAHADPFAGLGLALTVAAVILLLAAVGEWIYHDFILRYGILDKNFCCDMVDEVNKRLDKMKADAQRCITQVTEVFAKKPKRSEIIKNYEIYNNFHTGFWDSEDEDFYEDFKFALSFFDDDLEAAQSVSGQIDRLENLCTSEEAQVNPSALSFASTFDHENDPKCIQKVKDNMDAITALAGYAKARKECMDVVTHYDFEDDFQDYISDDGFVKTVILDNYEAPYFKANKAYEKAKGAQKE